MDPGALTRHLKVLQERGWIEREACVRDNRITIVTLSTRGREVVEQALPLRSGYIQDVLEKVAETTMRNLSNGLGQLEAGIALANGHSRAERDAPTT